MKLKKLFEIKPGTTSFVFMIIFKLKNGKVLVFEGEGSDYEVSSTFFEGAAELELSPKELATRDSVDKMIDLLIRCVTDVCDDRPIFEPWVERNEALEKFRIAKEEQGGNERGLWKRLFGRDADRWKNAPQDASYFIDEIRENIKEMDDISSIFLLAKERLSEKLYFFKGVKYDRETGEYIGVFAGDEFQCKVSAGWLYLPDTDECSITRFYAGEPYDARAIIGIDDPWQ